DGRRPARTAPHPAGVPQPGAVEPPGPGGARGGGAGCLRGHADQRGRAGPTERADHPVLRDQGSREPARRTRHGGDVLLSALSAAAVDQAAADGGRHARGDHQGHAGSDRRRARATRGAGARGLAARARPTPAPQQGRAAARQVRPRPHRLDRARRRARPRESQLLAAHPRRARRRAARRDGPPARPSRTRRYGRRGGGAPGDRETPAARGRVEARAETPSTGSPHGWFADSPRARRRGRAVDGGGLQRARLPQEPDAQRLQADRRPAEAASRPDPQSRERGAGGDGLREVDARGGDSGAQPGGEGERGRPRGDQADQPGGERPVVGAAAPDGGGGAVSAAQGDGERRPTAGGAHLHGEQGGLRAPALQRHGHAVQHQAAAVSHQPRRRGRPGAARRPVGDRGTGRPGRAAGRPVDEAEAVSGETALNLFQQQEANRRRTALLVIGFVVFFAWLGFGGDYIYHSYTPAVLADRHGHVDRVPAAPGVGGARHGAGMPDADARALAGPRARPLGVGASFPAPLAGRVGGGGGGGRGGGRGGGGGGGRRGRR